MTLYKPAGDFAIDRTTVHIGTTKIGEMQVGDYTDPQDPAKLKNPKDVIDKIWSAFADAKSKTWDGKPMYYYKNWKVPGNTAADLLARNDGQCDGWANFFIQVLKTQGIGHKTKPVGGVEGNPEIPAVLSVITAARTVKIQNKDVLPWLLVEKWKFPNNASTTEFNKTNTGVQIRKDENGKYEYNFTAAEVTDENGVPGQNTDNPRADFPNHAIVHLDWNQGTAQNPAYAYYDPSYGGRYTYVNPANKQEAWKEIENAAIAGFFLPPLGGEWKIRKNDGGTTVDIKLTDR